MSDQLAEFLLACFAEDEAAVVAVLRDRPDWDVEGSSVIDSTPGKPGDLYVAHARGGYIARHIARHDPARVLAECEAKRRIVGWYTSLSERVDAVPALEPRQNELGMVLRALALPYADHPDYREEWRP